MRRAGATVECPHVSNSTRLPEDHRHGRRRGRPGRDAPLSRRGPSQAGGPKRRYAIIGTGVRAIGMWGRPLLQRYADNVEFVGLCDINPKRAELAKAALGVSCPTFDNFDKMCDAVKPELLTVTTVDRFHAEYIVKALDRGIDVITEKPMVTDEAQCRQVLEAEARNKRKIVVGFNYRFAPKHVKIKEILQSGEIGTVTGVDFHWYLDTSHGADYFRRWHRLRENGSLWVHKATHHFDLINWWLDADPVEVQAYGELSHYGAKGPFHNTNCRPCPNKGECKFYWDITKGAAACSSTPRPNRSTATCATAACSRTTSTSGTRCRRSIRYSNNVLMSYSLNTFMPIEGYHLAFNGTKGRLEVRDYERQPWEVAEDSDIALIRNFGKREKIAVPKADSGHGGGDSRLQDLIFKKVEAPAYLQLPDSRAGAMSCLTGIAARKSVIEKRPVKIADLVKIS